MNAFPNLFVIVRVASDQRFVMLKGYSWKAFKQIVTVAYLKVARVANLKLVFTD